MPASILRGQQASKTCWAGACPPASMLARVPAPPLPHQHGRHRKVTGGRSREAANLQDEAGAQADRRGWRQQVVGGFLAQTASLPSFIHQCMRSRFFQKYELRPGMPAFDVPFLLSCMNESQKGRPITEYRPSFMPGRLTKFPNLRQAGLPAFMYEASKPRRFWTSWVN